MSEESKNKVNLTEEQKIIVREIVKQAKELGIDPRFAIALANLESSFSHVPADDKTSTAFGPFQVNKATAEANGVDYEKMKADPILAVRTGLLNIVRHANNPDLGGDPMRIAAAHRYGENSEFAKTGDPKGIDPTLRDYLVNVTHHFPESKLPDSIFSTANMEPVVANQAPPTSDSEGDQTQTPPKDRQPLPLPVQSALTGAAGAAVGTGFGLTHPVLSWAYDKAFGGKEAPTTGATTAATPEGSSAWPSERTPVQTRPMVPSATDDEYTRAEKQRLGAGDKSGMTGRESQTGYAEATGQQAARRKFQEKTAGKLGLDIDRPLAEYPNVASTKSGIAITQDELNRQRAEAANQRQLALDRQALNQKMAARAAQNVGAEWQKMVNEGLVMSQSTNPTLRQRGQALLQKLSSMSPSVSKSLPIKGGQFGFGAGAALPYSVELYQKDYPKTAAALPAAVGLAATKFPRTVGGLTSLAALMSAGYAAAHPREFSGGLTMHDINPTGFIGMPEESSAAFPEYQQRQGGAGRGFVNPPLAAP